MFTQLFEKALKEYFSDQHLQILECTNVTSGEAGDNYTTDTYRARVTYLNSNRDEKKIYLIVKCESADDEAKGELSKSMRLFEKETSVFRKVLPKLSEILGNSTLAANFVYAATNPKALIILEDISPLGFQMVPRQSGCDLNHCLLVLEKLATLHAASVVAKEKYPELITSYDEGLYYENKNIIDWVTMGFQSLVKAASKWAGFELYSQKIKNLDRRVITKGLNARNGRDGFKVLNHGDLWINNMLFKYHPDGCPKEIRFVDFQMCVYASPAIDLHYFLATSPKIEVLKHHLIHLLDYYYSCLLTNLSKLDYSLDNVPERSEFLKDFRERAFYGLMAAVTALPLVKSSSRPDASFGELMKDDDLTEGFRYHCYNNETYRKHMQYLLPYYDTLGILD